MNKINIVLADDEELFRKGMRFLLEREPNFNVVYEAGNGEELLNFIHNTEEFPDVILMDLKMPEMNGIEATKAIQKSHSNHK